jgi:hypothetical protein
MTTSDTAMEPTPSSKYIKMNKNSNEFFNLGKTALFSKESGKMTWRTEELN